MIRVLVVEDSPTIQKLLKAVLEADPAIEVIAIAGDGRAAVELTLALKPDIITMDLLMPKLDGYEAIGQIMQQCPTPIVVVTSVSDSAEQPLAFKAIQAGALDVVAKPVGFRSQDYGAISQRLTSAVKLMVEVKVIRRRFKPTPAAPFAASPASLPQIVAARCQRPCSLIAIGSSTGGPAALNVLLAALPADFLLPLVVVQHMSAGFMGGLISWLQTDCRLSLKVAEPEELLRPGTIYFAPDDTHIELIGRNRLGLNHGPMIHHVRPSVDLLFHSVARHHAADAVALLLTGMGVDGAAGMKAVHDAGGLTIAQDAATSVVYGMPGEADRLGAVDHLLPLDEIAVTLRQLGEGSPHPATR